jgi:predicted transcriptional regulator of viral defense system
LKNAEILYKVIRMNTDHSERILTLARANGLLRTRDVDHAGVPRAILAGLAQDGRLVKISRGLYCLPDRTGSEHDTVAEVAARSKIGVLCLVSALRFHELTTQQSSEIWLAIPHKAHAPRFDYPPLRIVRMSGDALTQGIDEVDVAGTTVRVFCIAKTVADCFKFRNKIGIDVALEALREAWQERRVNMDDLWRYAEVCRVANVMRPYIESVTSG